MKLLTLASNAVSMAVMTIMMTGLTTTALQITRSHFANVYHYRASTALSMGSDGGEEESKQHVVSIEYCTGCRWMLKSFWMAQELLMTFEKTSDLSAVTIIPSRREDSGGIYKVMIDNEQILWDRKEQGGFPSTKALKQLVRDLVAPDQFLGHSDTTERQEENAPSDDKVEILPLPERAANAGPEATLSLDGAPAPAVTINYCTGCRWLLRAAYFGQELMTTFGDELNSVTLVPSKPPAKGGKFTIELDGKVLFDRASEGRFPEVKEIKQMIRDELAPDMDLGHSDVKEMQKTISDELASESMSDEEAEDQRKFFGVS